MRKGAAHQLRGPRREIDSIRPLGNSLEVLNGIEVRRHALPLAAGLAGKNQNRDGVGVGLCHAREGVLNAGLKLHRADPDATSVGDPAEAVRDIHHHPLGPRKNGTNALLGERVHQRVGGKTTDKLNPFHF